MKKVIQFSKFFPCAVVLSAAIIISGIVSVATRGINFGLDFKPGMIEEIKIASTVLEVTYNGTATVSLEANEGEVDLVVSGIGEENRTESIPYSSVETVSELAAKMNTVNGVSAHIKKEMLLPKEGLFVNSGSSKNLGEKPLNLFVNDESANVTADDVRSALAEFNNVDVKEIGEGSDRAFQVRMGVTGDEGKTLQADANKALTEKFGADKVAFVKSDFIGAQFSQSLIRDSIILVLATLVLIFIYSAIRFHWDFALAAVIAIIHDALIMVSFISFIQMEFSTTTLAAILTIIGYSINATVVILDRVRSDIKVVEAKTFKEILNSALTSTLSRSIITTLTTLFAVLALFFFTTGTIHDFSLALTVGLISGCYSSIFIAGAFILCVRKNQKFTTIAANSNISQFKVSEDEDNAE
ncbi:protein translocase subunit SecF [Treponema sp.]|uniref:protein translocase subunit SecF n=1 Tax=Treponema sp. TaxID=166 RepID=UPI0025EE23FF|nr:protein translocase subunit SecF [Treponema sp.]MBR4323830.1 protein translocase subunit SecF [Treponema sp.]